MTPDRHEPTINFYSGEQGTTPTPVAVEEITPAPIAEAPVTPEKKPLTERQKKVIAAILGLSILVGGGIFGLSRIKSGDGQPSSKPTSSESIAPTLTETPTASPTEILPTVESLEVDGSLFTKPEELAKAWLNDIDGWVNAGSSLENAKAALASKSTAMMEYGAKIAAQYDNLYIEALLVDDWRSNPNLLAWVNRIIMAHAQTVGLNLLTSFDQPGDIIPYARYSGLESVISSFNNEQEKSLILKISESDYDNADSNRVGEALTNNKLVLDGKAITEITRKFVVVNGKIKLSDIVSY